MYTAFKFSSEEQAARAMLRWWSLPRYKRAAAIVKQHSLNDASEIFHRDARGKCYGQTTFVGELNDSFIIFDYWGSVHYRDAQYPEYCINDKAKLVDALLDDADEDYSE